MPTNDPDRVIRGEVVVDADVQEVWDAWTTEDGITSFFAPACHVEPRVDGAYEIFFLPDAEPGSKGGEDLRVLTFEPGKMLSFTWNAPPHMPYVRRQRTSVVLRFAVTEDGRTRVTLTHGGWGEGNTSAWNDVVLPRLAHRFSVGPVDWDDPPRQ